MYSIVQRLVLAILSHNLFSEANTSMVGEFYRLEKKNLDCKIMNNVTLMHSLLWNLAPLLNPDPGVLITV